MSARAIHLVGIGGTGMSGLALLARQAGYRVSGSDREDSATLAQLRRAGVAVGVGHAADRLPPDVVAIVVSTAIPPENPEVVAGRARGLPVLHRADLLGELMGTRRGIAVTGAHGKSTTTGMLAVALGDASVSLGVKLAEGTGPRTRWGVGPWFVAEVDESDRSMLLLAPEAAILLNVDHDHHTTFATLAEMEEQLRDFLAAVPAEGLVVVGPDAGARACAVAARCAVRSIGDEEGDWAAVEAGAAGPVVAVRGGPRLAMGLAVPGAHNVTNAACVLAMADWCGVPLDVAAARLRSFGGVGRRFELRGEAGGVRVVDDYAHHPAELVATLAAARERHPDRRLVAVFQPALFSRTQALGAELGVALGAADLVVVTDVYGSREAPIAGVSGRMVADAVPPPADARYVAELDEVVGMLVPDLRPGDLLMTLGSGSVTRLGQEFVRRLENSGRDDRGTPRDVPPA